MACISVYNGSNGDRNFFYIIHNILQYIKPNKMKTKNCRIFFPLKKHNDDKVEVRLN